MTREEIKDILDLVADKERTIAYYEHFLSNILAILRDTSYHPAVLENANTSGLEDAVWAELMDCLPSLKKCRGDKDKRIRELEKEVEQLKSKRGLKNVFRH